MSAKRITAALSAAILLAGCANTSIQLRSTNSPSIPGSIAPSGTSSYSSAAFQADVSLGAFLSLLLLGHVLAGFQDDYRDWHYDLSGRRPPELAEDRNIVDMDCSQPVDRPSANLRCR
ncbi:MAG: hypothetical protein ABIH03_04040 [Pseudomonadota bacterium]